MRHTARHACSWIPIVAVIVSCANDDARTHVFQSTPPRRESGATPIGPAVPDAAAPPIGTGGPTARVVALRRASTGAPAVLDHLTEAVDVVTLVSRGRGSSANAPMRLELRFMGVVDTTFIERLEPPVPIIVAHSFRIASPDGSVGLPNGRYALHLRLVGPTGRTVATSIPVFLGVRRD